MKKLRKLFVATFALMPVMSIGLSSCSSNKITQQNQLENEKRNGSFASEKNTYKSIYSLDYLLKNGAPDKLTKEQEEDLKIKLENFKNRTEEVAKLDFENPHDRKIIEQKTKEIIETKNISNDTFVKTKKFIKKFDDVSDKQKFNEAKKMFEPELKEWIQYAINTNNDYLINKITKNKEENFLNRVINEIV